MGQRRDGLRFAVEARLHIGTVCPVGREHLDGDRAVQPRVGRLVDFTHAARADERDDFVRTEACSGIQGHDCLPGSSRGAIMSYSPENR